MDRIESAKARFAQGYNCSQSVLSAYAPGLGLELDAALRVSAAFGGGMGRLGRTCGAVTGALMVLGLKHGATDASDKLSKEQTYALVKEFVTRFEARHGTSRCAELLKVDIGTPEGMRTARELNLFSSVCPLLVADAAAILEELGV